MSLGLPHGLNKKKKKPKCMSKHNLEIYFYFFTLSLETNTQKFQNQRLSLITQRGSNQRPPTSPSLYNDSSFLVILLLRLPMALISSDETTKLKKLKGKRKNMEKKQFQTLVQDKEIQFKKKKRMTEKII